MVKGEHVPALLGVGADDRRMCMRDTRRCCRVGGLRKGGRSERVRANGLCATTRPRVSIVIAARNEGARLPGAHRESARARLPRRSPRRSSSSRMDRPTTRSAVALAASRGAWTPSTSPARGKAAALNIGVARASGEILVFADARQMFAPDALRALIAPFADPAIGGVSGELILDGERANRRPPDGAERRRAPGDRRDARSRQSTGRVQAARSPRRLASTIADGVGLYWRYEKQLRRLESAVGSTLGATGAIYALRRSLWRPLPRRHDSRRRAGADAGGARGLPRRVQRSRARLRRAAATPTPSSAARSARSPATSRSLARAAPAGAVRSTRCGCSTCRTRSDGCSCRMRCWRCSRRASRSPTRR